MHEKDTDKLFAELKKDQDLKRFLAQNSKEFLPSLSAYLQELLEAKGLTRQQVIKAAGLERSYGYHIFSGEKANPSRPKILALALAMKLDLAETQHLLQAAGHSILYPRHPWDAVIITAIHHQDSVPEANEMLYELGEHTLLG